MFFRIVQTTPASYYRYFDVNADSKEEAIEKCKEYLSKNGIEEETEEQMLRINPDVIITDFELEIHEDEEQEWDTEDEDEDGGMTVMSGFPPLFLN